MVMVFSVLRRILGDVSPSAFEFNCDKYNGLVVYV